jgi:putative tricarboxylic transport membrane protein
MTSYSHRAPAWPETVVGLGVLVVAAVVGIDTWRAPAGPSYGQVGPAAFPYATAMVLGVLGVLLTLEGWRGGWRHAETEAELGHPSWPGFIWVALGLVLNAALIPWLGFILSSTLLFACVARGFASDRPARDLAIGFVLAFVAWYGFAKLLSINLGAGLIEGYF